MVAESRAARTTATPATTVNVVIFPNVTQLDFTGPVQVLTRLPDTTVNVVAATLDPVPTDCGFSVVPTHTWQTAPAADVLLVPGGQGAFEAMLAPSVVDFVREQAEHARWITSVCTGSFILGAAGLLTGRRATTHWAYLPQLEALGAIPIGERVVTDGAVITGAGVSSGIDFALTLAALVCGDEVAERIQLAIEYDPQPPFASGSAASAPAEWVTAGRSTAFDLRAADVSRAAARLAEHRR